jgi:iron complex transport system substrate-binding protein
MRKTRETGLTGDRTGNREAGDDRHRLRVPRASRHWTGLLETAYEAFLAASLREQGLEVETQRLLPVTYRGLVVRDALRIDLLVEGRLIIEVKSVERLAPVHAKQVLTYLRLLNLPLGLLINFGTEMYRNGVKRVINDRSDLVGRFTLSSTVPRGD